MTKAEGTQAELGESVTANSSRKCVCLQHGGEHIQESRYHMISLTARTAIAVTRLQQ